MTLTLGFDVYGTLIDTRGVLTRLKTLTPDKAQAVSDLWRSTQLAYTFRRGLMKQYQNFDVVTTQALNYALAFHAVALTNVQKQDLVMQYQELPAFPDAVEGVGLLKEKGHALFAFSNGFPDSLKVLLQNAGLLSLLNGIVSVHDVKTFKPSPEVYRYFLKTTGAAPDNAWLVSSNAFDVIGAVSAGMKAAWVQRSAQAVFDPWETKPTSIVSKLTELPKGLPHG